MRREIALPEEDVELLDQLARGWETAAVSGAGWCFLHGFPVPEGFNVREATLAVRLGAYPQSALDMVYFHPPLARADGRGIAAISPIMIDGKTFQQWSRHYNWTPGFDNLARHVRRASAWLTRELAK